MSGSVIAMITAEIQSAKATLTSTASGITTASSSRGRYREK